MHMVPGDPLTTDKAMTKESREALNKKYGFDKPLYEQYFIFLKNTSKGILVYLLRRKVRMSMT